MGDVDAARLCWVCIIFHVELSRKYRRCQFMEYDNSGMISFAQLRDVNLTDLFGAKE